MKRTIISLLLCTLACASMAQVSNQNYIRNRRMLSATDSSYVDNITYHDGQGRPFQTVSKVIQTGTVKERMATLQEYDGMGRANVSWLPTPISEDYMHPSTLRATAKGSTGYNDTYPCETTVYENSPLDRVWLQYGAGVAWNSSHPVTTEYYTNTDSGELACKLYITEGYTFSGGNSNHASGSLYVTKITDEDGHVNYTFTNSEGQILLERRMNGTEQLDTYYVYDHYGRLCVVLQPEYQHEPDRSKYAFQYQYNERGLCIWKKLPGIQYVINEYDAADQLVFSQDGNQRITGKWTFYVYDNLNRLVQQGESTSRPVSASDVYLQNHYDNYTSFREALSVSDRSHYPDDTSGYSRGSLTGTVMNVWGSSEKIYTAYYYDAKGRVKKTVENNLMGGYNTIETTYTFTDRPATVTLTHTANGKATQTEVYTYTYDHSDRISSVTHKLNSGSSVTLASYTYDQFGRIATKKLHGSSTNQLTYAYNIRSWLTGISSGKFSQNLTYNNGSTGFNGNITFMNWNANGSAHAYNFTYDGVNRMQNAVHGTGTYTERVTGYDKNGNITGLQRYGNGLIDNLTYTYNGNQLTVVEDATGNTAGFKNGASTTNEYTYDHNGNLTKDLNKGITNISYNSLNLPQVVTFSNGNTITYLYTADGKKLRTVHKIGTTTTTTDYCGNVIYENSIQKLLLTEEGYINLNSPTTYYYYLKDHQGNNRVVVNSSGAVQEVNHYYPFGSTFATANVQPYKYNGKELDTKNGLNWYDYGARHYDAALGRWHVVDPLAEKMYGWSPYGYCFNNPIKLVDIDGKYPGPGDLFATIRDAAKDWGWYYNGASIIRKQEMGSSIYEVKDKNNKLIGYSYTSANVGKAHSTGFSKPKNGENVVATVHSHGNYDGIIKNADGSMLKVVDNEFSSADKTYNNQNKRLGYLTTPNGSLLEHNPNTNAVTAITENLPSDRNDPNRKNKTNATESPKDVPLLERIRDWLIELF